jgi:hypothetical protein
MKATSPVRLLLIASVAILVIACGGASATTSSGGRAAAPAPPQYGSDTAQKSQTTTTTPNQVPPPGEGPKVIRTADLTVQVKNGTFDSSYDRLVETMLQLGGYVSGTDAQAETGSLRSGTLTFKVPADKFQEALTRIRHLGNVQHIHVGGQDVSLQYVDLTARLNNAKAQRDQMLTLLQQAHSINEIIAVQNQISQITLQIEQLQGQINYFDNAVSLSSISVSLREAAAGAVAGDSWGFVPAVSQAMHGFVNDIDYLVIGLGYALPFLILLWIGYLGWRWRRRHFAL